MKSKVASKPGFRFEKEVQKKGFGVVIGVDEVGRGALAGPVVAGAVAFKKEQFLLRTVLSKKSPSWSEIDDSKRLAAKKREELAKIIKKHARWGIGETDVVTINRVGIVKATEMAMRKAIKQIKADKTFVLLDAFHVKYISGVGLLNQKAIVKGDQKSISIAAASIVAKVHRDRLMLKVHKVNKVNKVYGWDKNKGYGTAHHIKAIRKYGVTKLHRKKFVENFI